MEDSTSPLRPLAPSHRAASAGASACQGAAFVLAEAAPDADVLTAFQRPREAAGDHGTAPAHGLRVLDLPQRRTGVACAPD